MTRDIRLNITICLQEFPRASPSGTRSGKGLYFTGYPSPRPNTDTVSLRKKCSHISPHEIQYISEFISLRTSRQRDS